jgi:hypothetical protein
VGERLGATATTAGGPAPSALARRALPAGDADGPGDRGIAPSAEDQHADGRVENLVRL